MRKQFKKLRGSGIIIVVERMMLVNSMSGLREVSLLLPERRLLKKQIYPEHLYKIILRYFGDYCFIVEKKGLIVGFAMGIVPRTFHTYFLWQVGVAPPLSGAGDRRRTGQGDRE